MDKLQVSIKLTALKQAADEIQKQDAELTFKKGKFNEDVGKFIQELTGAKDGATLGVLDIIDSMNRL